MPAGSSHSHHTHRYLTGADFLLDLRQLGRGPGSMVTVRRTMTAPRNIGLDLIAIPAGAPIEFDLRLESVSEGVLVTGTVAADTVGECARCLEPFEDTVEVQLTELFAYPDSTTERTTEEGEVYRIVDDRIDLEPVVDDAVGLALPLQPLCRPDCPGLCPRCGVRLAIAGPDHGHEILDPRWAELAAKFATPDTDRHTQYEEK